MKKFVVFNFIYLESMRLLVAIFPYRGIVQLVERWSPKPNVEGSSPSAPVLSRDFVRILEIFYYVERAMEIFIIKG